MTMTHEERMGLIPLKTKASIDSEVEQLDEWVENAIAKALPNRSNMIFATTKRGFVTLCGYAEDHAAKEKAAQVAFEQPGVRCVTNHIKLRIKEE